MTSVNVNYGGMPGALDVTVLPAEQRQAVATEKKVIVEQVASNEEYRRVPKGERKLKHTLIEEVHKNGVTEQVKSETVTKRRNR